MNITGGLTADPSEGEHQVRRHEPKGWRPKTSTLVVAAAVLIALGGGAILWTVAQPAPVQTASAECVLTGELPDPADTPSITPPPPVGTVTVHSTGCVYDRVCYVALAQGGPLAFFFGVNDPYVNPAGIPVSLGDVVRIEWSLEEVQKDPVWSDLNFHALAITPAPDNIDVPLCPSTV